MRKRWNRAVATQKSHIPHQLPSTNPLGSQMSDEDGLPEPSNCLRNALNLFMKSRIYRPVQMTVLFTEWRAIGKKRNSETPEEKLQHRKAEAASEKYYELEALCEFPGYFCACYRGRQTSSCEYKYSLLVFTQGKIPVWHISPFLCHPACEVAKPTSVYAITTEVSNTRRALFSWKTIPVFSSFTVVSF